jgi:hypothetical protein
MATWQIQTEGIPELPEWAKTNNQVYQRKRENSNTVLADRSNIIIKTNVYRKPNHTGQYLHDTSNNPLSTKQGIVKCLHNRATAVCTNKETLKRKKQL